jgi:hypothetical protein
MTLIPPNLTECVCLFFELPIIQPFLLASDCAKELSSTLIMTLPSYKKLIYQAAAYCL